jgi:hypothetical protein
MWRGCPMMPSLIFFIVEGTTLVYGHSQIRWIEASGLTQVGMHQSEKYTI